MLLNDKVAIVTGAGSGIGREIAFKSWATPMTGARPYGWWSKITRG